jgi:hypothetical protein
MKLPVCLFFFAVFCGGLFAQSGGVNTPSLIEQEQQKKEGGGYFQKQSGNLGAEENKLSEEEKEAMRDLGPVKVVRPPRYFTFLNDTSVEWDSNARLASANAQDSTLIIERLSLRYSREFAPQWRVTSTARQQFFWFTSLPSSDFLGQSLDTDVSYQIKGVVPKVFELVFDPRLFLGCNLYRYEDYNTGSQFVKAAVIRGGSDHAIPFFNGQSAFFYGYTGSVENTTPGTFDKHQHQVYGGWNQTVIPRYISAQAFYRFAYSEYTNVDRDDKNNLMGLTLNYRVNEWVNLSGFANYTRNISNVAEYQNLATGVLFNFNYRF